jgi:hypothetical protein
VTGIHPGRNEDKLANHARRAAVAMSWHSSRRYLWSAETQASLRMDELLSMPPQAGALVVLAHRAVE